MSTAHSPTKRLLRRDPIAVRHPEMRHPVQRGAPHQHLRRLPVKAAGTDSLAKDHLYAEDSRLSQRASMIVTVSLPLRAPRAADGAQVLIADVALTLRVAMLPDARSLLRRDRGARFPLSDRVITVAAVVGPVGGDLLDLVCNLRQQVRQQLRVLERVGRDRRGHQLPGGLVHAEMEFAPSAALRVPVLAHLPLALAVDLDAGRVHDQVQWLSLASARQLDRKLPATPTQRRVIGHAQLDAEQPDERARQPFGGTQWQSVHLFQRRHAKDGRVGVGRRLPALARALMVVPLLDHLVADPQRQTSTPDKSFVILLPVTETVLLLGFLAFHTSRLPALLSP